MPQDARAFNYDSITPVLKTGTDPALEVDPDAVAYRLIVPSGKKWKVETASMSLVAGADAANRSMSLVIYDSTGAIVWKSPEGLTITAGQTKTQTWVRNSLITAAGTQYGMHMPDITLLAVWSMRVTITNFDAIAAGDNASALTATVQEVPA